MSLASERKPGVPVGNPRKLSMGNREMESVQTPCTDNQTQTSFFTRHSAAVPPCPTAVQTSSDRFRPVQTGSDRFRLVGRGPPLHGGAAREEMPGFPGTTWVIIGLSDRDAGVSVTHRPVSEEEIIHLREQRYAAISDQQELLDKTLRAQVTRSSG